MVKVSIVGRNDPCICGSGKKYKKCCLPRSSSDHIAAANTYYFPRMKEFDRISIPDDCYEACVCYEILTNSFECMEEKFSAIQNLHLLIRDYPQIGDLWALLIIGYREIGRYNRSKKIFKQARVRFPKNLTIRLLSYLMAEEKPPEIPPFDFESLTEIFIWGYIRVKRAFEEGDRDLALDLMNEMMKNAEKAKQLTHWALRETIAEIILNLDLDADLLESVLLRE